MSIEWREPPPLHPASSLRKPDDWQVPDELRARPGQWALVKTTAKESSARSYRHSRSREWGADFELITRGNEVYARYQPKATGV